MHTQLYNGIKLLYGMKGVCRVENLDEFYNETKKLLDRELEQQEIELLTWVFDEHVKEKNMCKTKTN